MNVDTFLKDYGHFFKKPLQEMCVMSILKKKLKTLRYTPYQKWLGANALVGGGRRGLELLRRVGEFPSQSTVLRTLRKFKTQPGISSKNTDLMRMKSNPDIKGNRFVFILIDEMSLRLNLDYDQSSGTISGFVDMGESERTNKIASSALCVMVVGVITRWKFPLGYFFTESVMKHSKIVSVIQTAIKITEDAGYCVLGITSDQGSNFEHSFSLLGSTCENPTFDMDGKRYFIYRDPPHLLKNARNLLAKKKFDIKVPGFGSTVRAKWEHIEKLHERDERNSLKLAPKIKGRHIYNLKFATSMKVKLAANILSHSVSAALDYMVAENEIDSEAMATSQYCLRMNNIFDILNSRSSKDKVWRRRPLQPDSKSSDYLKESLPWLRDLQELNSERRCSFIKGFIQSINVALALSEKMSLLGYRYLSLRNICQDPLELFFGKIRGVSKFTTASDFSTSFGRLSVASLIRPPKTGNCEENEDEVSRNQDETVNFMEHVSEFYFQHLYKL